MLTQHNNFLLQTVQWNECRSFLIAFKQGLVRCQLLWNLLLYVAALVYFLTALCPAAWTFYSCSLGRWWKIFTPTHNIQLNSRLNWTWSCTATCTLVSCPHVRTYHVMRSPITTLCTHNTLLILVMRQGSRGSGVTFIAHSFCVREP